MHLHAAWHDFLTALAGLPDEALALPAVVEVAVGEEILLQAAAEVAAGQRPEILDLEPGALVRAAVRGRSPLPADLARAALCDGHRDLVAEHPALEAAMPAQLRQLGPEAYRRAAAVLRAWRAGRFPEQGLVFHMAPMAAWAGRSTAEYRPPSLASEGFIHFTREPERLEWVAEQFYSEVPPPMVVLVVDLASVEPEVRWVEGFPHVHGPLHPDAVLDVRVMAREDGRWRFPWA